MEFPTSLPTPNPTVSYWQTPPHSLADYRSTVELPGRSEYVVIGSGVTGTLLAYKLLSEIPDVRVTVIEARQACSGATGRNGGNCRTTRYLSFKSDVKNYGLSEALKLEALEERSVSNIPALASKLNIACDLRNLEAVEIFTLETEWEEMKEILKAREDVCGPGGAVLGSEGERSGGSIRKVFEGDEVAKRYLIPDGVGAVSGRARVLSPYKFVCGVLQFLIDTFPGRFNLQTNTPVLSVSQQQTQQRGQEDQDPAAKKEWIIETANRGSIKAENVILATNAYTQFLFPEINGFIIPTRGQLTVINPTATMVRKNREIEEETGMDVLGRGWEVNTEISGDYYHCRYPEVTGDQKTHIVCGGGRGRAENARPDLGFTSEQPVLDDGVVNLKVAAYQRGSAGLHFGRENWGGDRDGDGDGDGVGELVAQWTGIMGYTKDREPLIGEAPGKQGLWICAGFHGHGMATTERSAEALVGMILGRDQEVDEWLPQSYKLGRIFGKK